MDISTFVATISEWSFTHGPRMIATVITAIFSYRFFHFVLDRSLKVRDRAQAGRTATLHAALLVMLRLVSVALVAVLLLPEFGFSMGPFLASLGIVGLGLSFGSQTLVRDFVAGLFLVAEDTCRVGEEVEIGGVRGRVEGLRLRTLAIRKAKEELVVIPYGEIKALTNFSRPVSASPDR
ncbi:MAG: hypothetical protein A2682_02015 [Candidatus Terrybacteria bacterium RIFCSPHIGHO2_01_FULL_58_15]|uniref:Mechanosensitive ion channel protein MscS n=1 Tax=Terrybacteria sp. (strain RIFCSPHIGHO2_01_FULL_58_15) TaxID=1802363 RepID=A0A1G2PNV0_TERXR|nr:MAG: hypothetical protein A2682_02015 [Candidatus Terrybacteria bacterium RIFCSPHIGHO2_01_FULL_58_15]